MFSSTMVAMSATRPWVIQLRGNTRLVSARPKKKTPGSVEIATRVSGTWMLSMNPTASTKLNTEVAISGANAR